MGRYTQTVIRNIGSAKDFAKGMLGAIDDYLIAPLQKLAISRELYDDALLIGYVYALIRHTPASDGGKLRGQLVGVLNIFGVQCLDAIMDQSNLVTAERGEIDRSLVLEMAKSSDTSKVKGRIKEFKAAFPSENRFRIAHDRGAKFAAFVVRNLFEGAIVGESQDSLRLRLRNMDALWERFRNNNG